METNIIKVQYEEEYNFGIFSKKEYSYYTNQNLKIGDLVEAPTLNGISIARVSNINIPEEEIETFKDKMRTISKKINRDRYLKFKEIQEDAA